MQSMSPPLPVAGCCGGLCRDNACGEDEGGRRCCCYGRHRDGEPPSGLLSRINAPDIVALPSLKDALL